MDPSRNYRRVCEQLDCRVAVAYLNALRNNSKSCIVDGLGPAGVNLGHDSSLYAIAATISQSGLAEFGIDKATLGVDILWAFINSVARTRTIDVLRITNCVIEEKGQEKNLGDVGAALGQLHIHTLDLSGTVMHAHLFQQFVAGTALFKLLRQRGLRELRLTRCELQDEHVEMMVNALVNLMGSAGLSFSLRKLVLGHNHITDHGTMVLARLLEGQGALAAARLQLMDLQHNEITNLGAEVLFKACERAKALAHINMTGNYLGDASIRSLAGAWRLNPGVASQVLLAYSKSPKQWTQEGILSLLQAATRADHLVVLDIRGLKLTETLVLHSVCRLVLKSNRLEVLRVDTGSASDIHELWAAIKVNKSLIQVWIGCEILNDRQMAEFKEHQQHMVDHLAANYALKVQEKEKKLAAEGQGVKGEEQRPDELKAELALFDYVQGAPLPNTPPRRALSAGGPAPLPPAAISDSPALSSAGLRIRTQPGEQPTSSAAAAVSAAPVPAGSNKFGMPTMHWMQSDSPSAAPACNTPESTHSAHSGSQQSSNASYSFAPPSLTGSVSPSSSQPTSLFSDDKLALEGHDGGADGLPPFDLRSLTGYGTKYYAGRGGADGRSVAGTMRQRSSGGSGSKPSWGAPKSRVGSRAGSVMGDRKPPSAPSENKFLPPAIAFRKYDSNKDLLLGVSEMVMALGDTGVLYGMPPIKLGEYLQLHQSGQVAEDDMYGMTDFMTSYDLVLKFKALQAPGTISVSVPIGAGTNKPLKRVFKAYCMSGGLNTESDHHSSMPLMIMLPLQFRAMCADAGFLQPLGPWSMMSIDIVFSQCKEREKAPRLNWINFLKALVVVSQEMGCSFDHITAALTSMPLPTMETSGTFTPVRFVALHEMDSLRNISAKVAAKQHRSGGKQRRSSGASYTSDSSYTSSTISMLQTVA